MARRALPLAAALATLVPTAQAALAEDFVCRGHDPTWELVGRGAQATLAPDPGGKRAFTGGASVMSAEGLVVWRGRVAPGQPDLVAVMLRGACTDPTAGEVSTYLGIVSLPNGGSQVGCCSYGAVPGVVAAAPAAQALGEGDAEDGGEEERREVALAEPPPPPPAAKAPKPAPAAAPPAPAAPPEARAIKAGSTARVAGPSTTSVNLRVRPGNGTIVGQIAGGRRVVVQQSSRQGGQVWYKIRGRGVPANAWIRGDLLQGG